MNVEPSSSVISGQAMRSIPVRAVAVAAAVMSAAAGQAGAQLTVTQSSACPSVQIAGPAPITSTDTSSTRSSAAGAAAAAGRPDVVLIVAFSADELRFNSPPDARIRFCWGSDSLHVIERRNLPSPVVAGTTYRNVFIAAELRAYLNAECLSERLGVSDSTPSSASNRSCGALRLNAAAARGTRPPDTTSVSGSSR
jgi:hypothetical protein